MKKERGFSAFEMLTVTGIVALSAGMAAPSVIKANRSYQLSAAAQQVSQAFQSAKFEALRNNTSQTVLIDPVANTVTINGRTINLPTGVTFQSQQSSTEIPDVIKNAASNGANISGQQSDEKMMVSFPKRASDNKYEATFNSRGMPNVQPGAVNWIYLVNSNGERVAITLSSAGSTNTWRKKDENVWKDSAGNSGGGSGCNSGSGSNNSGSGS